MGYYFVRYMPKKGEPFPQSAGVNHPALITWCNELPVGVDATRFLELVKDPFERALVLTTGIIIEYEEAVKGIYTEDTIHGGYIKKAWRAKRGKWFHTAVQRGHRLKVKE